jgi:hypothetical protein
MAIPLQQKSPEQARDEEHNGRLMFLDERQPITSSNVDSLLWDEDKNTVYAWFRYVPAGTERENATTATMYVYRDVNPVDWFELIGSESQGIHMANTFINRYTGVRVGGKGAWPAIGTYRPDLTFAQAEAKRKRG